MPDADPIGPDVSRLDAAATRVGRHLRPERALMSLPSAPAAGSSRRWPAWPLPWLCSSTAHAALLVVLALQWPGDLQPAGPSTPIGLDVSFAASSEPHPADAPAALAVGRPSPAAAETEYFEDEPPAPPPLAGQDEPPPADAQPDAARPAQSRSLAALLTEKPAVNLSGVLPAAVADAPAEPSGPPSAESPVARTAATTPGRLSNRLQRGEARTSVFGAVGEGRRFVYVFDRSGSMDGHSGAPLRAAKDELLGSLQDLGQTHQFQIIFYNEHPRIFSPSGTASRLVFGNDQNKNLARKFVGSITADGATRHEEALELAIRLGADVIFFLTDADEPRLSDKQLARIAELNSGTSINTIEFGFGPPADSDNFLVKLARQNGGQHVYVDVGRLSARR